MFLLTTIATMNVAAANTPTAMYALCKPIVLPLDTTALKLDSPKGRAFDVVKSSGRISPELTTESTVNSSGNFQFKSLMRCKKGN